MAHRKMKRTAPEVEGNPPLMKRQAKASASKPQAAPPGKAPIAKVPPAGKAPIGKAPIAKVPGKAPIAKRPPPAKPAAPGLASPPPSPGAVALPVNDLTGDAPSRGASWQDFSEVDPLYALLGELGDKKVVTADGELIEDILEGYIERLVKPGVAQPKDWIEVWAAMNIPVEINAHAEVVQRIIEIGVRSEVGDMIGEVLAELVKGHRAKVKAVEQAMMTIFECGCDEKDCLSRFLLLLFPTSPTTQWGWSRVGWNWDQWWKLTQQIFSVLETGSAFEALRALLSSIETESGTYLPHQQIWDEKRLGLVRAALCDFGSLQEDELAAAVDISLS